LWMGMSRRGHLKAVTNWSLSKFLTWCKVVVFYQFVSKFRLDVPCLLWICILCLLPTRETLSCTTGHLKHYKYPSWYSTDNWYYWWSHRCWLICSLLFIHVLLLWATNGSF
jgi:hypothetical protein